MSAQVAFGTPDQQAKRSARAKAEVSSFDASHFTKVSSKDAQGNVIGTFLLPKPENASVIIISQTRVQNAGAENAFVFPQRRQLIVASENGEPVKLEDGTFKKGYMQMSASKNVRHLSGQLLETAGKLESKGYRTLIYTRNFSTADGLKDYTTHTLYAVRGGDPAEVIGNAVDAGEVHLSETAEPASPAVMDNLAL